MSLGLVYLLVARHGGTILKELLVLSVPGRFLAAWLFLTNGEKWKGVAAFEVSMGLLGAILLLWA
jgi:hypothetical protein